MWKPSARHGIPEMAIPDSVPQVSSTEFAGSASIWDFNYTKSSPFHSQENGKAETSVKKRRETIIKCAIWVNLK